ncbi:MAG: IS66 family transposase zinc-finger binding domain-containing protein [Chloroflexi bacterium]|nr:IS66 family transposase zinc-finger binding domain-containing protein [Chloroflexota bacterium]
MVPSDNRPIDTNAKLQVRMCGGVVDVDLEKASREELVVLVRELIDRVKELEAEVAELRARLGTNSRNSGKPPSSDGPGIKPHPKSQRKSSGRKPGGQHGHVGHSLRLVDDPDEVKVHTPSHCKARHQDLGEVPATHCERRQVVDIPPVKMRVVEHQVESKVCPECGVETSGTFPDEVAASAQYGPG